MIYQVEIKTSLLGPVMPQPGAVAVLQLPFPLIQSLLRQKNLSGKQMGKIFLENDTGFANFKRATSYS